MAFSPEQHPVQVSDQDDSERYSRWYHREDGFALTALALGKKALFNRYTAAGTGVLVLAGGPLLNTFDRANSLTAEADLNAAETESVTEILAINERVPMAVAGAWFKTEYEARGIQYAVTATLGVGPLRASKEFNFEGNKKLTGIGKIDISLPHEAIVAVPGENGVTNFEVDGSQLLVEGYYGDGSPHIVSFTIDNNGNPNFDDRQGFRDQVMGLFSAVTAAGNVDFLNNLYEDLDKKTNHDMSISALSSVREQCPIQIADIIAGSVEKAIEQNVNTVDQDGTFGEVYFVENPEFTVVEPPDVVKQAADGTAYTMDYSFQEPTVDTVVCTAENPEVANDPANEVSP